MPEWLAIVIAIISGGALEKLIDNYLNRRKTNGTASLAYAQASGLTAAQNAKLLLKNTELLRQNGELLLQVEDLLLKAKRCNSELIDAHCNIKIFKAEVTELRLALGRQLDKQE